MESAYKILGVTWGVGTPRILQAYRKMSLEAHPDRARKDWESQLRANLKFQRVRDAYEALSTYREIYELRGWKGFYEAKGWTGYNEEDNVSFEEMFRLKKQQKLKEIEEVARAEAEAKERQEGETKVQQEAEAKERQEAETKVRQETEAKERQKAEAKERKKRKHKKLRKQKGKVVHG